MEKHLITLTIRTRVEADVNHVVKAQELAVAMRAKLWLLDGKGGRRCLQGQQVLALNPPDYMDAATNGLLYVELDEAAYPKRAPLWAFAPAVDEETGFPVLMERYETAFAKRSLEGVKKS